MLTADVRVEEFDTADWFALTHLLSYARSRKPLATGGVVVLLEGDRVVQVTSTTRGRLDAGDPMFSGPLAAVADGHGVSFAVRLERAALTRIADGFAVRIARGDDVLTQGIKLLKVVRALSDEGVVEIYPRDFRTLFAKERLTRRLVDALCPAGKTMLFAAFENGEVHTSVALHRGERGFDRIVGPGAVRGEMGLVSGDWARDARGVARAVELGVGPLSIGCFAETAVWRKLIGQTGPGTWTAAVAARELVFHPLAPALAIPFGVDVGRAAVAVARDWATRFGVPPLLGEASPLRPAFDRVRDLSEKSELERRLGFDPFALLADLFGPNRR
jgi:hypothetical protein